MKHTMKRSLSLVLALCMVLGLVVLPGVTEAKAEDESLLSTPLKSSAMDVLSGYYPQGWKQSANKGAASLSSIQTDDGEGARTFYQMKVNTGVTKEAFACWKWEESTFTDKTLVLRYDVMVDASSAEAKLYLPTFSSSESGRLINLDVVNNVLTYGTNTKVLAQNRWYEIEITFSGTNNMTIYVDGERFAYDDNQYGVRKATTINYVHMAIAVPGANVAMNIDNMAVYDFVDGAAISAAHDTYTVGMNKTISNIWSKTAGAYLPSVKYTSSNEDVAKVDANGVVTGVGIGEAVITATPAASSGMVAATTTITVENPNDLISTPVYSHAMDARNDDYVPQDWAKGGQYSYASKIGTDEENNRTYYHMERWAGNTTTGAADSYAAYNNSTAYGPSVLKFDLMVDTDCATWSVYPPIFAASNRARTIGFTISHDSQINGETVVTGKWYTCELVYEGSTSKKWTVYIDGSRYNSGTASGNLTYINMANPNSRGNSGTNKSGVTIYGLGVGMCIDNLEVYNYVAGAALTAAPDNYEVAVGSKVIPVWNKTDGAFLPSVKYTSSDNSIATVDENGVVTGLKDGTVTITATPAASSGMSAATTTVVVGTGVQEDILKFSNASLVLQDNLAINFKANANLFTNGGYSDPYAVFAFNNKTYTVTEYNIVDGQYVFQFTDIAPHMMGDDITYTLVATRNGEKVSSTSGTYSVLDYCTDALGKTTNMTLKTLLVDTLNYGAAAQTYKNYNTGNLVNARLTEDQKTLATADRDLVKIENLQTGEDGLAAQWKFASLLLDDAITVKLTFTATSKEGLTVKINDAEQEIVDSGTEGTYYVYYPLTPKQLSDTITAEVFNGETVVSKMLSFSAETYAATKAAGSDALADLVTAMMKYGDAAKAYVPAE